MSVSNITVQERPDGFWAVTDSGEKGPFPTNAAAWAWLDRNTNAGRDDDKHRAIREAMGKW
jgi:hypothetical protein